MKELIINQDLKKENLFSDKNFKAKFASSHLEEHLLSLESKKHILKMDFVTKLKQFILTNFKRYGDFMEYNSSLLNEKHKKIF